MCRNKRFELCICTWEVQTPDICGPSVEISCNLSPHETTEGHFPHSPQAVRSPFLRPLCGSHTDILHSRLDLTPLRFSPCFMQVSWLLKNFYRNRIDWNSTQFCTETFFLSSSRGSSLVRYSTISFQFCKSGSWNNTSLSGCNVFGGTRSPVGTQCLHFNANSLADIRCALS